MNIKSHWPIAVDGFFFKEMINGEIVLDAEGNIMNEKMIT